MAPHLKIDPDNAEALQNWIIVAEMFVASVGMLFAFPWSEYQIGGTARGWSWDAFTHAVSIMDVLADIMHQVSVNTSVNTPESLSHTFLSANATACSPALQFNPSYGSYLLYDDGGPAKNVKMKKYRGGDKDRNMDRNMEREEFSAATSATTQAPKRSKRRGTVAVNEGEASRGRRVILHTFCTL